MDDYGTEVKLLAVTVPLDYTGVGKFDENVPSSDLDAVGLLEWAGRLCYNAEDKFGAKPGWIQARIKDGHLSILEHASATFYIRCSRVVTHELVRHRIASYSQRSQRFVREDEPRYITPPEITDTSSKLPLIALFNRIMNECWEAYSALLEEGIKPEIARYVLPNACQTEIVMTMNFRELRHFINLRTSPRALPEMQEVAGKVKDICKVLAPEVFEDV